MNILFSKYNANGNDFILIQAKHLPKEECTPKLISKLCNRNLGIGANGIILITESKKYDFLINYYNSDGSWETFCANGSRCAAKHMMKLQQKFDFIFKTGAGSHSCKISPLGSVVMDMVIPKYEFKEKNILGHCGAAIDSGARHFVAPISPLDKISTLKIGKSIRNADCFKPRGINVNLYKIKNRHTVEIITYEKGVEEVVMSCSSGSAAVVYHLAKNNLIQSPIKTISPGGNLSFSFDKNWSSFYCEGPTKYCFTGTFNLMDYSN
tara:strand:+ start:3263 stop:4060 length:798 start_codon:yes stop_codon:yes gene_type:complete